MLSCKVLQLLLLKMPVPRLLMLSCMVRQLLLLKIPVPRLLKLRFMVLQLLLLKMPMPFLLILSCMVLQLLLLKMPVLQLHATRAAARCFACSLRHNVIPGRYRFINRTLKCHYKFTKNTNFFTCRM